MPNKPTQSEAELYDALAYCATVLYANFATPHTIEGNRALAAVNKARTALINFTDSHMPSNAELLLGEIANAP